MQAERIDIDSQVVGRPILGIYDFESSTDFAAFERDYVARHQPFYVTCKIPLERIAEVHALEDHGFRLIECQIRSRVRLNRPFDVSGFAGYRYEEVKDQEALDVVLELAGTAFSHDRFTVDGGLGPELAGARYRAYVRQSFQQPNEAVFRLVDCASGQTVAFRTHRYLGGDKVLLLLGGVRSELRDLGLGPICAYYCFNDLLVRGIRYATTHISAANYPVFNLEIGRLGFRVLTTFAVMRKIYPSSSEGLRA
ncbi:MAG: hypothetical protein ACOYOU_08945 [Kiritimatiellia bacterium]